eukprot:TRINITY_DN12052_c0_g1_i1.p1 TRINITY_DN12052_c0_g1~~TRINITY_DN12052_c0_g1_i1.p1  ORF type:complete len:800 (-),score=126.54 TRINITY_DN12052_c0_g1_i1:154-2553(-)
MCDRLREEHNVHVPRVRPGLDAKPPAAISTSWHALFLELLDVRRRLDGKAAIDLDDAEALEQADQEQEQFSINVAARFRRPGAPGEAQEEQTVVLPLHQKIQIVRDRYDCTRKEALEIIMQERGTKALDDHFSTAAVRHNGDKENRGTNAVQNTSKRISDEAITVLDDDEDDDGSGEDSEPGVQAPTAVGTRASILAVREDTGTVLSVAPGVGLRDFTFDQVFNEKSQQAHTYERCAQRLVMDFLNGVNASVICYGQTGSGKTYTMFGPTGWASTASPDQQGIVPRTCEEVLNSVHERRERGAEIQLGMSYVEVFGSEVSDLLRDGLVVGQGQGDRYAAVRATDRVGHRYVLDGHTECDVDSWEEVREMLEKGDRAKRLAATAMNERSTRAHTLLVLSLTQTTPSGLKIRSKLFLADLGGSEKVSKSKADAGTVAPVIVVGGVEQNRVGWQEYYHHRKRIQETLHINKGLFALKKVIEALHLRSQLREAGTPSHMLPYVPYQDSKLTMLLADALGGRSRTLVVCTASMDPCHAVESLQTLRFGERCAQVRQQGNSDKAAAVQAALEQLAEEIREVEAAIVLKERWETRLVLRRDVDTVAGAFGAEYGNVVREEVIPTSVLVGAEQEREQLEMLLQRQMDLQGLGGQASKDYREMAAKESADGGRGKDFRNKDRFRKKMKAKDFEDEVVVAEALRFLFRKANLAAETFGETAESQRKRLSPDQMYKGYFTVAQYLRSVWADELAQGSEKRSFGKAMMDKCQEWTAAFKGAPEVREEALRELLARLPSSSAHGSEVIHACP